MSLHEKELLEKVRDRIRDQVTAFSNRVEVIPHQLLLPESYLLPACGVMRGAEGFAIPGADALAEEEVYETDIWVYDSDFTDRDKARQNILSYRSSIWDALTDADYNPTMTDGLKFLHQVDTVGLGPVEPFALTETGEYILWSKSTYRWRAILISQ